jgi:hypothetical protein
MADHEMNAVNSVEPTTLPSVELDDQVNLEETPVVPSLDDVNTEPLRNASPLPESDRQMEEKPDSEYEAPVAAQQSFALTHLNHTTQYQALTIIYVRRFGLQTLLWIQALWTLFSAVASTSRTIAVGVTRSLQTQMYIFFQGSCYPYRAQGTMLAGPGIAPIEWYYNADSKIFLSSSVYNSTNDYETHHLNWLTGEVKYNDLVLYDISEFLQQVRWAGSERPSPALVLSAWSIHSGIVLHFRQGLVLKTINEDGTESALPLRG